LKDKFRILRPFKRYEMLAQAQPSITAQNVILNHLWNPQRYISAALKVRRSLSLAKNTDSLMLAFGQQQLVNDNRYRD